MPCEWNNHTHPRAEKGLNVALMWPLLAQTGASGSLSRTHSPARTGGERPTLSRIDKIHRTLHPTSSEYAPGCCCRVRVVVQDDCFACNGVLGFRRDVNPVRETMMEGLETCEN